MRSNRTGRLGMAVACLALIAASCGSGDDETEASAGVDGPTIVVTTNILGDVLEELVGDQADVVTIMPVGADPHDFQASAQEVDLLLGADALIVNGSDFEEGLLDVIASAGEEGVPTFEATSAVETIEFGEGGHGHEDEEHKDDEEGHDEHGHDGDDPHFFTDPNRMSEAVRGIADFLTAEVSGLDEAALTTAADEYIAELDALDAEVVEVLGSVPEDRRVLVTTSRWFVPTPSESAPHSADHSSPGVGRSTAPSLPMMMVVVMWVVEHQRVANLNEPATEGFS